MSDTYFYFLFNPSAKGQIMTPMKNSQSVSARRFMAKAQFSAVCIYFFLFIIYNLGLRLGICCFVLRVGGY